VVQEAYNESETTIRYQFKGTLQPRRGTISYYLIQWYSFLAFLEETPKKVLHSVAL